MAKTEKVPLEVESLREGLARFTKQGDRGTALIAAAWVDDALDARLRAVFRSDKKVVEEIVGGMGPLSSFGARIKLAYLLDVIERNQRKDLDIIRGIRNDFAHRRGDVRFSTPSVRDRCRLLHAVHACRLGGWSIRSPKQQFLASNGVLSCARVDLINEAAGQKSAPGRRGLIWILDQADGQEQFARLDRKRARGAMKLRDAELRIAADVAFVFG